MKHRHVSWTFPEHKSHRNWSHKGPMWAEPNWGRWRRRRKFLFLRFIGMFGFFVLLVLGGMGAFAFVVTRFLGGTSTDALAVWVVGCGLSLILPGLGISLAIRAFRSIATPITNVMAAADALADGDLSVRVPESGTPDFRQLARSFNRMADELERADQQRRNLTADVAHELRTPLHIIQGNLEGILDGVYEVDEDHINVTLDEVKQLTRMVDDLQVLSLAEGGALPLEMEQVVLIEALDDVRTSFSGAAEAAEIDLIVNSECEPTMTVYADPGRLNQVLTNLVSNALRYTPAKGEIVLRAECIGEQVRISVIDTGEGITPEDLTFVFERFWRADRARMRHDKSGGGLGLAIAKKLVEVQGGEISVESEIGVGSNFTFFLLKG